MILLLYHSNRYVIWREELQHKFLSAIPLNPFCPCIDQCQESSSISMRINAVLSYPKDKNKKFKKPEINQCILSVNSPPESFAYYIKPAPSKGEG
jgi:hypothetical protein